MRRLLPGLVLATLVAALAVPRVGGAEPVRDISFRVLDRPQRPSDALPRLEGTFGRLVVPGSARRVGRLAGGEVFIAVGRDDTVCFLHREAFGTGGGCKPRASYGHSATYLGSGTGNRISLIVPVPDGYDHAEIDGRRLEARDNVVLTTVPRRDARIAISGDRGTLEVRLPFG